MQKMGGLLKPKYEEVADAIVATNTGAKREEVEGEYCFL